MITFFSQEKKTIKMDLDLNSKELLEILVMMDSRVWGLVEINRQKTIITIIL